MGKYSWETGKRTGLDRKRILIFSLHYEPYIGGAEVFLKDLVNRLDHDFTIVTRMGDRKNKKIKKKDNVTIVRVGGRKYDKYLYPWLAYRKALEIHRKKRFEIVHSIMANHAGLAGMWFSKKTKVPFVLNLQMGQSDEKIKKKLGIFYGLYKKIYLSADKIHAISNFLKERAIRMGVDKGKVEVIPNGADLKKFDPGRFTKKQLEAKKKENGLEGKKVLVTSSRLSEKNGIADVIKAMSMLKEKHDDLVFLILGSGELEKELKDLAGRLGVDDRVIFKGHVEHDDLPLYLCMSDIFIRPSLSEGQGISFIEAMACKIPVIATPVGGIPDFIEGGKTGFFCEAEKPGSVSEVIGKVMGRNNREVIRNAKGLVEKKYEWEGVINKINRIYGDI